MIERRREVPFLVQSAWACLDYHHHHRCSKCIETDFCPMVEAARHQIREWRRYRAVLGWR